MEMSERVHQRRLAEVGRGIPHCDYGPMLVRSDGSVQVGLAHGHTSIVHGLDISNPLWAAELSLARPGEPAVQMVTMGPEASVHVIGRGPLAATIAEVIVRTKAAKVVRVTGSRRSEARCDLAVIVDPYPLSVNAAKWWQEHAIPYLPVQGWGRCAVLGPVVVPGVNACVQCLEYTRADLDPEWPFLRAQLPQSRVGMTPPVTCEPPLLTVVAGLVAAFVQSSFNEGLPLDSRSWELTLPGPVICERAWSVHPLCRCTDHAVGEIAS